MILWEKTTERLSLQFQGTDYPLFLGYGDINLLSSVIIGGSSAMVGLEQIAFFPSSSPEHICSCVLNSGPSLTSFNHCYVKITVFFNILFTFFQVCRDLLFLSSIPQLTYILKTQFTGVKGQDNLIQSLYVFHKCNAMPEFHQAICNQEKYWKLLLKMSPSN